MKYFIGVLVILFFVIVGVLLFVGRDDKPGVLSDIADTSLSQYASEPGSKVTWTKRGKIVAKEDHYAVQVTVTAEKRTVEVIRGYDGRVISSKTFNNTEESYRTFLAALDNLGFQSSKDARYDDVMGACPTGYRYEYKLESGVEAAVDSWSTSCSSRDGTFAGKASTVRRLFQEQIPEFNDLTDAAKF